MIPKFFLEYCLLHEHEHMLKSTNTNIGHESTREALILLWSCATKYGHITEKFLTKTTGHV